MNYRRSESITAFAAAFAKAQSTMSNAAKDSTNPFYHSKYADLASVRDACMEDLNRNGIGVMQFPRQRLAEDGGVFVEVETVLMHESAEWVADSIELPVTPRYDKETKESYVDAQAIGSTITYARRYALAAMCGVAPEDDDGNAASGGGSPAAKKPAQKVQQPDPRIAGRKILETASAGGLADLAAAWKLFPPDMQAAMHDEKERYKLIAAKVDEGKKQKEPVHA